jgi:cephalosporin-C deacetylase
MLTDMDEAALWEYRSTYKAPADFDEFWRRTLEEAAALPLDVRIERVTTDLRTVEIFGVTFAGYGGHPVRAWLRLPRIPGTRPTSERLLPGVVQFHGYGSGRGHVLDDLLWASAGYAHLLMDVRGQGGGHAGGDTGDPVGSAGPTHPGFLTKGLENPEAYYYRRVYVDAVRALQVLREHVAVDGSRVGVVGASQGGGIALAVAGLVPDGVAALHAQSPFLCDIRRATRITDAAPYSEIATFLAAHRTSAREVFETLGYFDGLGFAARATAPAWFSAGLMDGVCPPSTAFGAYHAYAGPKSINLWEYNGHDAGGPEDLAAVLSAFRSLLQEEETS